MKEGWTYKKLGEVCEVISGQSPDGKSYNNEGEGTPFYQGKKEFSAKYIGEPTTWTIEETKIAIKDDILMSVRAPVGDVNFATQRICIGRGLAAIRPSNVLNKDFIFYFLLYEKKNITGKEGAVFPSINRKEIMDISISVPPLPEQQAIVSRLDSAFAQIDALKVNAEKQLQEARKLFQAELTETMKPKEGWEEKKIGDVAEYRGGIAHEQVIDDDGCYIVINSKFVATEGKVKKYSNKQLSPLYKDDIVMVLSDVPNGKTLAKCYIVEQDGIYTLNQRICAFRSKGIYTRFLYYMLNRNPHLLSYDNGENQTNLRVRNVTDCPVFYPKNLETQHSIVAHLDTFSANVKRLEELQQKTLAECDALKQAMLREVFE